MLIALVSFLLLWSDTMIKVTQKNKESNFVLVSKSLSLQWWSKTLKQIDGEATRDHIFHKQEVFML